MNTDKFAVLNNRVGILMAELALCEPEFRDDISAALDAAQAALAAEPRLDPR